MGGYFNDIICITMSLPSNIKTRAIFGSFADIDIDDSINFRPTRGYVLVSPQTTEVYAKTSGSLINIEYLKRQKIYLDELGQFNVDLLVSNQEEITPINWTYKIQFSWLQNYEINFVLEEGSEPINIGSYIEDDLPEYDGQQTIVGPAGRGISSLTQSGNTLIFEYTDDTTDSFTISTSGSPYYVHTQNQPANTWLINHNLGKPISSVRLKIGTIGTQDFENLTFASWREIDFNNIEVFAAPSGSLASGEAIIM